MAKSKPEKTEASFEANLDQLESIVHALEEGGLPLDEAMKQFETGIRLFRACEKALTEAEKKIEILTKNAAGELEARPFGEDEDPAPADFSDDPEPPPPDEDSLF